MQGEENFCDKEDMARCSKGRIHGGRGMDGANTTTTTIIMEAILLVPHLQATQSMLISSQPLVSNHLGPACQMVEGDSEWVEGGHLPLSVQINDIPNICLMAL